MKELEHRVLRVGPRAAPSNGGSRVSDRLAFLRHGLPVRFHLELLEIEGQETEPLVIGEHPPRLTAKLPSIETIRERRDQGNVGRRLGNAKMPVHLSGTFEQG